MAGYGYLNRGYTGYTDDRSKKTYGESGYFDPSSRPTIFEAEGRKRPIVSNSPNPSSESYITKSTDKIVEYGRPPIEPVKDYGYTDDKWRRSPSPVRNHPQRVEEFISNVQVEPNRGATRPGFLGTTNWRNQPYSGNSTGYGEHDNYRRNDSLTEPAMINQDGGEGQMFGRKFEEGAREMNKQFKHSGDTRVSGPTNDIGKAMGNLQEAAKTSPVSVASAVAQPWSGTATVSTVVRRETYTPNPASRYGSFNLSSRRY
ncbi:unnamed protein product [Camellia sinensis]|uniref:Uncharacterized protein n=1 Tax=Camellia sinensis var. sinensis TaxID=542762 RepID=A0A4S4D858_CAMSN|nr:hypothetical protein TEA_008896 [Camellia sinensis var. sinensis]